MAYPLRMEVYRGLHGEKDCGDAQSTNHNGKMRIHIVMANANKGVKFEVPLKPKVWLALFLMTYMLSHTVSISSLFKSFSSLYQ